MGRYGKYLAGLFVGLAVLGLLSPAVSAESLGSVTLEIQQKTWYAEADVTATIFYNVLRTPYGQSVFAPLEAPYNYVHFGSHSGTDSNAYWKSVSSYTSEYKHYAQGWWHVDALWNSKDGTMEMWLWLAYQQPTSISKDIQVESVSNPTLVVTYTVDDSGGNELAKEVHDIAVGVTTSYLVEAG
jgi:hypothetical protein